MLSMIESILVHIVAVAVEMTADHRDIVHCRRIIQRGIGIVTEREPDGEGHRCADDSNGIQD